MSGNKLSLLVNFIGVDKMSDALKNIVGLGRRGSQALNALRGDARRLGRELRDVRRELAESSGNVTDLINRERELERQLQQTNRQMRQQRELGRIDANAAAMRARGEDLMARGRDNIVGGAAMLAPIILAGRAAADFSSGMVDIQQKAELTDAATARLSLNIQRIARDAAQFPEDVRAGLDLLLARGMKVDAATAAMRPATRLATAYKVEIPDAAGAAFASLTNLKIAASDTARVFDVMATAGNMGGFEIRDMARYFPALTAQMQALDEKGVPAVANLSAALQVAMHTAGNADEAGNNIVNLLAKINSPGTIRAFEKNFGVNLPAAMKKLTDQGYSALEAIALVTEAATKGDDKRVSFAFEDRQAQMGLLAIMNNLKEFRDIRDKSLGAKGTVDRAFDQRVANDQALALRSLGSEMANMVLAASPVLLPFLREVTAMLKTGVGAVTTWAQAHPGAASMLFKLVAGLAVAKIALGGLQLAFGGILGPMSTAYKWFGRAAEIGRFGARLRLLRMSLRGVGPMMVRTFGMMRTAALFLGQGLMRAGMMMLANPIVLVITAIVLAVGVAAYLIYRHWDTIKAAFWSGVAIVSNALQQIRARFVAGWEGIKSFFASIPAWLTSIGRSMMQGLLIAINPFALGARLIAMAKNGIAAFKKYLGIQSPSRVFMGLGGYTVEGLVRGIDRNRQRPVAAMSRLAGAVAGAGALALTPVNASATGAGGRAAAPAAVTASAGGINLTVNIYQLPGEDAEAFADRVVRLIERKAGIAARRTYEDDR